MWSLWKHILTHILQDMRALALKHLSIVRSISSPAKKHRAKQHRFPTAHFGVRRCNQFSSHRRGDDRQPHLITFVNLKLVPHRPQRQGRGLWKLNAQQLIIWINCGTGVSPLKLIVEGERRLPLNIANLFLKFEKLFIKCDRLGYFPLIRINSC